MTLFRKITAAPRTSGTLRIMDVSADPADSVTYCAGRLRGFEELYGITTSEFLGLSYVEACARGIEKFDRHVWTAFSEDLDNWAVSINDLSHYPVVCSAPVLNAAP